ncbi:MAG: flagellin, partial [Lachnospiraceae bacterium]|nr:flagellin [Lachnospiraceae bacterium]
IMSLSFKGVTSSTTTVKTFLDAAGGGAFAADGTAALNVTSQAQAQSSIAVVKTGLQNVSSMRSALGAIQNRLEHTIKNLDNVVENTTAAESQIRDTDMATEMVKYSNNNVLAQAGQAMLAQANQANQGVLSLLGR